jgi:hypothetical protein
MEQTVETLQKELEAAGLEIAKVQQDREDALAINRSLSEEIEVLNSKLSSCTCKASAEKEVSQIDDSSVSSFTYEGEEYVITQKKFTYKKQVLTPVEICASPELQKQLVEMKSGVIKKKNS